MNFKIKTPWPVILEQQVFILKLNRAFISSKNNSFYVLKHYHVNSFEKLHRLKLLFDGRALKQGLLTHKRFQHFKTQPHKRTWKMES